MRLLQINSPTVQIIIMINARLHRAVFATEASNLIWPHFCRLRLLGGPTLAYKHWANVCKPTLAQ